jgi:hypothetical protein
LRVARPIVKTLCQKQFAVIVLVV